MTGLVIVTSAFLLFLFVSIASAMYQEMTYRRKFKKFFGFRSPFDKRLPWCRRRYSYLQILVDAALHDEIVKLRHMVSDERSLGLIKVMEMSAVAEWCGFESETPEQKKHKY